ncbi:SRPBCC family protein [Georgfuchsia toluolica]|uniref:SRPBCC family protein n=1 Tax=Georgfuchsia toluolica TaxID=424218 RepID=UPI001C72DF88|nr:carbon monoxide dehydrogenase subunit G [Georgfuchsia toluolica]
MEMSGSALVPASLQKTWELLNDPETLKSCINGCESIERISDTAFRVSIVAKIGPISARFKGQISLADLNPPSSYSISFEGQGGASGFARGSAKVNLAPEEDGTRLNYVVNVQVGGKLAQVGSRLIDGTAKKIADEFFATLAGKCQGTSSTNELSSSVGLASGSMKIWLWSLLVIAVIVGIYIAMR